MIESCLTSTNSSISYISRLAGTRVGPDGIAAYCIDVTVIRVT